MRLRGERDTQGRKLGRKPGDETDVNKPETPSPFDPSARVAGTCLECPATRNTIPGNGRHILLHNLYLYLCCFGRCA